LSVNAHREEQQGGDAGKAPAGTAKEHIGTHQASQVLLWLHGWASDGCMEAMLLLPRA
jgi:hypothetical protein